MKRLKQTGFEVVVLGVIGLIVAAAANVVRAKGSITLGKNYFYIPEASQEVVGKPATAKHDFQEIDYEEAAALLEDPDTEAGLNVFLDARNDDEFGHGHIRGAVQCDPYNVAQYWDDVEPLVQGAMKIVVYCGGGDCEDSIFMCRELQNQDIPWEAIYLYEGGWNEWTAKGGPAESGRTE